MIVEIIGSSGSGKTTIARQLQEELMGSGISARRTFAALLGNTFAAIIHSVRIQNFLMEVRLLPRLLRIGANHPELLMYADQFINETVSSTFHQFTLKRSVRRRLAIADFLRENETSEIVTIVDEGALNIPQIVYANGTGKDGDLDAALLAGRLPVPDVAINLNPPKEVLLSRTRNRPDSPKLMATHQSNDAFISRALFATQSVAREIKKRILVLEIQDSTAEATKFVAQHIRQVLNGSQAASPIS